VILGVGMALPLLVLERSGLDGERLHAMLSLALVALAIGTLLQVRAGRHIGSGLLIPATFTAAYLGPCLDAMTAGGPSLVMGMLMFAGLFQVATALALVRLRPYLPPEIGGLAVLMIGITLGLLGVRLILQSQGGAMPLGLAGNPPWLGAVTLGAIVALGLWAKGPLRTYASLGGILVGGGAAVLGGVLAPDALFGEMLAGGLRVPVPSLPMPGFDPALAPSFAVGALTCSLRAIGDVVTAQRVEDTDWVRPDLANVRRGVIADGAGTVVAGLLGSPIGMNTFSGSVGLAAATGVTARRVGWAIAGWLLATALLPGAAALFLALPKPILGGVLLVSAAHIVFNGLLVITSRMLDARRIQMIGLPLLLGLSFDVAPQAFEVLPDGLQTLTRSSLMIAVIGALLLNLLFRIGVGGSASVTTSSATLDGAALTDWVVVQGGAWGARTDVMHRVAHALTEVAEARDELMTPGGDVRVDLAFDEYRVDLRIEYDGLPIDLTDAAPLGPGDLDAIDVGDVRARLRAGLIRRLADRVDARPCGPGRQLMRLRFEH
jgi:xanthine/uracil permease